MRSLSSTTGDGVAQHHFPAGDDTRLAYHRAGADDPVICVPGGPMLASAYLGDLGGLGARRSLLRLDLRGTGGSAAPADPATYRCDRQVADVEALRVHLGHDRLDLVGHSAGATIAVLYAARHPDRVARLALVAPSPRAVGVEITDGDRRELAERRHAEPWFPAAFAAFERIWAGAATDADWAAIQPFLWGRFDDTARDHLAREAGLRNAEAAARYYAPGAFDPGAVRSALTGLRAPVLLLAGEHDVGLPPQRAAEYAALFPHAEVVVQPGAGHYPWYDDPGRFARTMAGFLR
jgi:pimeloyl-ACP methyl ester carboxylesterase